MDPTTQMGLAALAGSLLTGAAALAWVVSDRQMNGVEPRDEPIVPAGVDAVLAALRSSAVLLDENDVVVRASAGVRPRPREGPAARGARAVGAGPRGTS
ncbi:MAG: hypothetical protein U0R78_19350 [Nocardioidaceae bacterium]